MLRRKRNLIPFLRGTLVAIDPPWSVNTQETFKSELLRDYKRSIVSALLACTERETPMQGNARRDGRFLTEFRNATEKASGTGFTRRSRR